MTVDVNVSLSRYPFRRLRGDETPELVAHLRARGVRRAWAGSFDALLHKDLAGANLRLAEECRRHGAGLLVPFGAVDPSAPDWEEDLRRCHEDLRMPGLRLHPNYHGYRLDDPRFERLLRAAAERGLVVQIAIQVEDDRTQHPLVRVPRVDEGPLPGVLARVDGLKLVLLNALSRALQGPSLRALAEAGGVSFDLSTVRKVGGVEELVEALGSDCLLFGSHAPFFTFEAMPMVLREAGLGADVERAIRAENARRLLPD